MLKASEIRSLACTDLKGRWLEAAMLTFVYMLIAACFSSVIGGVLDLVIHKGVGSIVSILLLPMGWGYAMTFVFNRRGDSNAFGLGHLIDGYKDFERIFMTLLLQLVYTFLWTLLLVVPGIIKRLSYAMTSYILLDNPELKGNAAIERSMAMMCGHKMQLFWLYLTFIGWAILCIFSFGIGYFWLCPYMQASMVRFYEQVKGEYGQKCCCACA
ncbi:MAG: DUF975 family protein [Bacteroidaceae bacterium]|nr:DUF975 family protein [Bacteroidaceae bacterium]